MTAQAGFILHGYNVVTIQVTSYHERCLKGTLSGALIQGELSFRSTIDLLCLLEKLMDEAKYPQRSEESRVFRPAVQHTGEESGSAAEAKKQTIAGFQLNVMFRQNATWQGSLFWMDQGLEAHFRSVKELLNLIDSALSNGDGEAA